MSSVLRRLEAADPTVLVGRLTLAVALVNARGEPLLLVVTIVATVLLALREDRLRHPLPWLAFGVALGAAQATMWWQLENHVIATTYWVLAFGLSRFGHDPDHVRRLTGRLLLGVIFAFAFGWKLLSSQFVSTDFFRYTLVWDERFEVVAGAAGTDVDDLHDAQLELAQRTLAPDPGRPVQLPEGDANDEVAGAFTIWGLVSEGAVALFHLLPFARLERLRAGSVFLFGATTYLVAPVVGFGLLLLLLTTAATSSARIRAVATAGCLVLGVWGFLFPVLFVS